MYVCVYIYIYILKYTLWHITKNWIKFIRKPKPVHEEKQSSAVRICVRVNVLTCNCTYVYILYSAHIGKKPGVLFQTVRLLKGDACTTSFTWRIWMKNKIHVSLINKKSDISFTSFIMFSYSIERNLIPNLFFVFPIFSFQFLFFLYWYNKKNWIVFQQLHLFNNIMQQ